jgi:uncharacterized protein (TIGR03437 family)
MLNGKGAFVFCISPTQILIVTPAGPMSGPVRVQVTNDGQTSAGFAVQARCFDPVLAVRRQPLALCWGRHQ